jgi:hypothetical protein
MVTTSPRRSRQRVVLGALVVIIAVLVATLIAGRVSRGEQHAPTPEAARAVALDYLVALQRRDRAAVEARVATTGPLQRLVDEELQLYGGIQYSPDQVSVLLDTSPHAAMVRIPGAATAAGRPLGEGVLFGLEWHDGQWKVGLPVGGRASSGATTP